MSVRETPFSPTHLTITIPLRSMKGEPRQQTLGPGLGPWKGDSHVRGHGPESPSLRSSALRVTPSISFFPKHPSGKADTLGLAAQGGIPASPLIGLCIFGPVTYSLPQFSSLYIGIMIVPTS